MRPRADPLTRVTRTAPAAASFGAEQGSREREGRTLLAHAARSREKIGVGDAIVFERMRENAHSTVLRRDVRKGPSGALGHDRGGSPSPTSPTSPTPSPTPRPRSRSRASLVNSNSDAEIVS